MNEHRVENLFVNFLKDDGEYEECRAYWAYLVSKIADKHRQSGEWKPWVPRTKADGVTPLDKEFLTVYDGRSARLDRAFRIKQHEPIDEFLDIAAWTKRYEAEFEELPREELIIGLSLSNESATIAEILLDIWMVPETSIEEMDSFITKVIK